MGASDKDVTTKLTLQGDESGLVGAMKNSQKAVQDGVGAITGHFNELGHGVEKVIGLVGMVGGVVAGGAAFKAIISETVSWELETGKLAKTIGITTEEASTYKVAMHTLGIDQDIMAGAALRMAKTLTTNSDAYKQIGVDIDGMKASGKSNAEIMMVTIKALDDYKGGLDKNTMAQTIFSRSWKDVQQLQKLTPEILEKSTEEAEKYHLIVGPDGIEKAKQYKMAINELHTVQLAMTHSIGMEMLPLLLKTGQFFAHEGPVAVEIFRDSLTGAVTVVKTLADNSDVIVVTMTGLAAPAVATGITAVAEALVAIKLGVLDINAAMAANPVGFAALMAAGTYLATKQAAKGVYGLTGIDLTGMNKAEAEIAQAQASLGIETEQLNKKLRDLGLTSWKEFEKAEKAGKIVFDDITNTWKLAEKKTANPKDKDKEKDIHARQMALEQARLQAILAGYKMQSEAGAEHEKTLEAEEAYYHKQGLTGEDEYNTLIYNTQRKRLQGAVSLINDEIVAIASSNARKNFLAANADEIGKNNAEAKKMTDEKLTQRTKLNEELYRLDVSKASKELELEQQRGLSSLKIDRENFEQQSAWLDKLDQYKVKTGQITEMEAVNNQYQRQQQILDLKDAEFVKQIEIETILIKRNELEAQYWLLQDQKKQNKEEQKQKTTEDPRVAANSLVVWAQRNEQARIDDLDRTREFYAMQAELSGLATEKELLQIDWEQQAQINSWAMLADSEAEYEQRKLQLTEYYEQQRTLVRHKELQTQLGWAASGFNSMSTIADAFYQLSGKKSKEAFKAYQVTKSIETAVTTHSAAMKAYDSMVGVPFVGPGLAVTAAAAAYAAGAVAIDGIWSASVGGSMGSGSSNASGSAPVTQPVSTAAATQPLNVTFAPVFHGYVDQQSLIRYHEDYVIPALRDLKTRGITV